MDFSFVGTNDELDAKLKADGAQWHCIEYIVSFCGVEAIISKPLWTVWRR